MADLIIKIGATAKEFKAVLDSIQDDTESFGDKIASAGKLAAAGLAALSAALTYCVYEFAEAEKVAARTNAILKATGNIAGVSAGEVSDLAAALQKETTFSDEAIQSAENVLLTFNRIGKDVFPQATEATLDLATRMGVDASSAAQTLGKALQRPSEGLAQLQRQGITFTEQQKAQILYFEQNNQVAEAQKIILDKLASSFGGLAKGDAQTLSGSLSQLKNSFSDVAETIGEKFAPYLKTAAGAIKGVLDYIKGEIQTPAKIEKMLSFEDFKIENDFKKKQAADAKALKDTQEREESQANFRIAQAAAQAFQYRILLLEGFSSDYIGKLKEMHDLERQMQTEFDESKRENMRAVYQRLKEQIAEQEAEQAEEQQATNDAIAAAVDQKDQEYINKNQQLYLKIQADTRNARLNEKTAHDQFIRDQVKAQIGFNNDRLLEAQKFNKAYAEINYFMRSTELGQSLTFFTTLQSMTQSHNQTLKSIGKAAALTQIGIDTARGATQALSAFPIPFIGPALGMAAAAAIVAFGIERSAQVLAANQGGLVTGGIAGMDSVPAMLTPGELVVPQQNFDEVINSVIAARTGSAPSGSSGSAVGSDVRILIDLTQDASQLITAKQIEDSRLGLSRA